MTDSALIKYEEMTPADVFKPDMVTKIIAQVEKKAREHVPDLTTGVGRKAVASNAQSVARSKTFLDKQGKALVEPLKEQAKAIDAERKRIREALDALKEEVRKPLTEWEKADAERQERAKEKLAWLRGLPAFSIQEMDIPHIQGLLDDAAAAITDEDTFGDLAEQAQAAKLVAIDALEIKLTERKQHDKDQAELAEFRRMKEEADARDAEELKKRKAEKEKEEREAQKKRDEEAQKEREEKIREEAAEAERKRIEEAEKVRLANEAAQAEQERLAEEKRVNNVNRRKRIEQQIIDDLAKIAEMTPEKAQDITDSIVKGEIRNLTINY